MKTFDSFCCVCKEPANAPRGNFNAKRVTLCKKKRCRRQRKSELQREQRRQKNLPGLLEKKKARSRCSRKGKKS